MADKHSITQLLSQHAGRWSSPAEIKAEVADVPDRTLSRWLGELVRQGVIEARINDQVQPQHRDKFKQDVLAELDHLDNSRMGGLGITREQLEAWLNLRTRQSSSQS
jgi:hypothetical protein